MLWLQLRRALISLWHGLQRGRKERRSAEARARFWAELREGEREAESRSRP